MENRICLLGFSGSVLSLIFSTLNDLKYKNEVAIIENMEVNDLVTFECSIPYTRTSYDKFQFKKDDVFAFSMMTPAIKKKVFDFFNSSNHISKEAYTNILHPSLLKSSNSILQKGVYVEPGCVVSPYAQIGFGVSVNRGSTIGHHVIIQDFATINPGVHIAGHCHIGATTSIGIGTAIFDHITIGCNSIIGGGSVVTKNIPDNVLAFGNPCRVVKQLVNNG